MVDKTIEENCPVHFPDQASVGKECTCEEFWTVTDEPVQANGYQNVILTARDNWGGGRTKFDWELDFDNFGCWGTDFPNHFCGGLEDLENYILALVNARNILARKWDKQWFNAHGEKAWEVEEKSWEQFDKEEADGIDICECHHAKIAHLDNKPCGGCDCEEYKPKSA